jgi:integrase
MSLHFDDPIEVHLPHETVRAVVSPELDRGETAVLLVRLPEPSRTLVFLLALTGLRISELLALRWRNVDLVTSLLRVEETVYEGHFDEPKSRHSVRLIPLGPLAGAGAGGPAKEWGFERAGIREPERYHSRSSHATFAATQTRSESLRTWERELALATTLECHATRFDGNSDRNSAGTTRSLIE